MLIGLVGKPNTGKSTFFNASTLASVPVAGYPFTTIEPNIGVAYVRKRCVCREFDVQDDPQNSYCIDGDRFIPFKLVDTAGLVPEAWKGRGLGNQFLDKISRADVLIHLVDASGSTDLEGNPLSPGAHDPLEDISFLGEELSRWLEGIIRKYWSKTVKKVETLKKPLHHALYETLSGLNFNSDQIRESIESMDTDPYKPGEWRGDDLLTFAYRLLQIARPTLIAANKIDLPNAEENIDRIKNLGHTAFTVSAVSELALRRAAEKGCIHYLPGDSDFEVLKPEDLTDKQREGLERIRSVILEKYGSTGVQQILNAAVFEILDHITVYPVSDADNLTDSDENILPDAFLLPRGSTVIDLAEKIHSDIAKNIIFAIDVRSKRRISPSHLLKDNDVIQIVSASKGK